MKNFVLAGMVYFGMASNIFAASLGETVGFTVPIENNGLQEGAVICNINNKFEMCNAEYSVNIAGVYNQIPALYIDDNEDTSSPLVSAGKAWVLVSGENGNIKKGDYITSSQTAGVGIKATRSGMALGIALEDFTPSEQTTQGKIGVLIDIRSVSVSLGTGGNLWDSVKQGFVFPNLDALASLRYWLAILICIVSFTIGFVYYGKISRTGIEAMGRNPLAGRMIQINLVVNLFLVTVIMVGGLLLAYAIVVI